MFRQLDPRVLARLLAPTVSRALLRGLVPSPLVRFFLRRTARDLIRYAPATTLASPWASPRASPRASPSLTPLTSTYYLIRYAPPHGNAPPPPCATDVQAPRRPPFGHRATGSAATWRAWWMWARWWCRV